MNHPAVDLAVEVFSLGFCETDGFHVHRGRAVGDELLAVPRDEERRYLEERSAYFYRDGSETRTWFSLRLMMHATLR